MASLVGHHEGRGEAVLMVQRAAAHRVAHTSDGGIACGETGAPMCGSDPAQAAAEPTFLRSGHHDGIQNRDSLTPPGPSAAT